MDRESGSIIMVYKLEVIGGEVQLEHETLEKGESLLAEESPKGISFILHFKWIN